MGWLWCGYGKRFGSVPIVDSEEWDCKPKELINSDEIVDIGAKNSYSLFLTKSGAFYGLGANYYLSFESNQEPFRWKELNSLPVTNLACGSNHVLLIAGGKLCTFGWNADGQCGRLNKNNLTLLPPDFINLPDELVQCAAGDTHSLILTRSRQVYSFGKGKYGQLGLGLTDNQFEPKLVSSLSNKEICKVVCGWSHSLAISESGETFSWGWGGYLQLGQDDTDDRLLPTPINDLVSEIVRDVAAGGWHSVFLTEEGRVYTCGWGEFGQLGHGNSEGKEVPTVVKAVKKEKIVQIACGSRHTVLLNSKGEVFTFGFGKFGNLGYSSSEPQQLPRKIEGIPKINSIKAGTWSTFLSQ